MVWKEPGSGSRLGAALSRLRFPIYHIRCSSNCRKLIKPRRVGSYWSIYVDPCRQLRRSCCLKRKMSSICLPRPDKTPHRWVSEWGEVRWTGGGDKVTKAPVMPRHFKRLSPLSSIPIPIPTPSLCISGLLTCSRQWHLSKPRKNQSILNGCQWMGS